MPQAPAARATQGYNREQRSVWCGKRWCTGSPAISRRQSTAVEFSLRPPPSSLSPARTAAACQAKMGAHHHCLACANTAARGVASRAHHSGFGTPVHTNAHSPFVGARCPGVTLSNFRRCAMCGGVIVDDKAGCAVHGAAVQEALPPSPLEHSGRSRSPSRGATARHAAVAAAGSCSTCANRGESGAAGQARLGGVMVSVRIDVHAFFADGGCPDGTPGSTRRCTTCGRLIAHDKGERAVQDVAVRGALSPSPLKRSARSRSRSRGATARRATAAARRKDAVCGPAGGSRDRATRHGRSADGAAGRKKQQRDEKGRPSASARAGSRVPPDAAHGAQSMRKTSGRGRADASSGGGRLPDASPRQPAPGHRAPARAGWARESGRGAPHSKVECSKSSPTHRTFSCVL